jgi:hypothetical protein
VRSSSVSTRFATGFTESAAASTLAEVSGRAASARSSG